MVLSAQPVFQSITLCAESCCWLLSCFHPKTDSRWIAYIQALYALSKRINVYAKQATFPLSFSLLDMPIYSHNTTFRISKINIKNQVHQIWWKKITLVERGAFLWQTKVLCYIWCKFCSHRNVLSLYISLNTYIMYCPCTLGSTYYTE